MLFLSPGEFEALFDATALGAGAVRQASQRDLLRALRASWRPQARLAVGR